MNISQLKRLIPLTHQAKVTPMVWGHHGIGKSQSIKELAGELGLQFIDLRLGQMDVGDLLGLAEFVTDADGVKISTKFMPPNWFPRDPNSKGILFLDELFRARPDVQQAVFQLVLDRRLHEMVLPEGWMIVSANNPDSEDYKTEEIHDAALMDRFLHVKLVPKNEEFFEYAGKKKFDTDLLNFLKSNEEVLSNPKLKDFTLDVTPSKRSWDTVNRLMTFGIDADMFIETVGGMVGIENAARVKAYMENNRSKPVTAEQILNEYSKHAEKIRAFSDMVSGRHDIINITCDNLADYLFTIDDLNKKQEKNLNSFLDDVPLDIGYGFFKNTFYHTKDGKTMSDKISIILDKNEKWTDIIMNDKFKKDEGNDK